MPEKTYAEKPSKGKHEEHLDSLPPNQRASERAAIMSRMKIHKDEEKKHFSFVMSSKDIEIEIIESKQRGKTFEVTVSCKIEGEGFKVNNPVNIVNPPLKVPNGTWRVENINGEDVDCENFEESPESALKEILKQFIISEISKTS